MTKHTYRPPQKKILPKAGVGMGKKISMSVEARRKLTSILKHGLKAKGRSGIERLLNDERNSKNSEIVNTRNEAILAKCYDCCSGYADGLADC
jgi:hypothetical protein